MTIHIILSIVAVASVGWILYKHYVKKDTQQQAVDAPNEVSGQDKQPLEKEQIEQSLDRYNHWIDNCDQKASVLLAIVGVVATLFFTSDAIKMLRHYIFHPIELAWNNPSGFDFSPSRFWVLVLFVITSLLLIATLAYLILIIRPNLNYTKIQKQNPGMEKKSILFYMSVAEISYEDYKTTAVNYLNDLRSQAYACAKIATNKFINLQHAIFYFILTTISASLLFIAVMFMH